MEHVFVFVYGSILFNERVGVNFLDFVYLPALFSVQYRAQVRRALDNIPCERLCSFYINFIFVIWNSFVTNKVNLIMCLIYSERVFLLCTSVLFTLLIRGYVRWEQRWDDIEWCVLVNLEVFFIQFFTSSACQDVEGRLNVLQSHRNKSSITK